MVAPPTLVLSMAFLALPGVVAFGTPASIAAAIAVAVSWTPVAGFHPVPCPAVMAAALRREFALFAVTIAAGDRLTVAQQTDDEPAQDTAQRAARAGTREGTGEIIEPGTVHAAPRAGGRELRDE
jgi:hypothetical protein